jgi:Domain of unknown function (DUF5679)
MYCVTCKNNTETINTSYSVTKNNRNMMRGNCAICGRAECQFVKLPNLPNGPSPLGRAANVVSESTVSGGDLVGALN